MSQIQINLGTGANTKNGDTIRLAFSKVNDNFTELYSTLGPNLIPPQLGNGGSFLTTNGTSLSWQPITVNGGTTNELVNGEYILSLGSDGVITAPLNSTLHVNVIKHTNGNVLTLANIDSTAKVEIFDNVIGHQGTSVDITAGAGHWRFSGGLNPPRFVLPNGGYIEDQTNGAVTIGTHFGAEITILPGGNLVLPPNGNIINSDGSVYGGSNSSGNSVNTLIDGGFPSTIFDETDLVVDGGMV